MFHYVKFVEIELNLEVYDDLGLNSQSLFTSIERL